MPDIGNFSENRNNLARLPRQARARGFRILRDWQGTFSLIDTKVAPQRSLSRLTHVPLNVIGTALATPLPPPKPKRVVARAVSAPVARLDTDPVRLATPGNGGAL